MQIDVIIKDKNNINHKIKSLFIINPDPKDLWKIIEPPSNGDYYKKNTDKKLIVSDQFNLIAGSRRGRSHEHNGSFRDDDFYIENEKLKEIVENQKLIISRMEKDIQTKIMTIDYLTRQLVIHNTTDTVDNLLDFD
jgi:hypothetical protein